MTVRGAGAISCGKLLNAQGDAYLKDLTLSWAQGFLSGMNVADADAGKEMLVLPDSETISVYLVNYCTKNPLEQPVHGAENFYNELRSRNSGAP